MTWFVGEGGAAVCPALVRGEGSYKAAAERAGGPVTVSFIRKWARVAGDARLHLAWATIDHGDLVADALRDEFDADE